MEVHTEKLTKLEQRVARIDEIVRGNGRPGLDSRTQVLEDVTLRNKVTGADGLVVRVHLLERELTEAKWLIRVLGAAVMGLMLGGDLPAAFKWLLG